MLCNSYYIKALTKLIGNCSAFVLINLLYEKIKKVWVKKLKFKKTLKNAGKWGKIINRYIKKAKQSVELCKILKENFNQCKKI